MGRGWWHASGLMAPRPGTVVVAGKRHRIRWIQHAPKLHQVGCDCGWVSPSIHRYQQYALQVGEMHIAGMVRLARTEAQQKAKLKQTRERAERLRQRSIDKAASAARKQFVNAPPPPIKKMESPLQASIAPESEPTPPRPAINFLQGRRFPPSRR